MHLPQMTTNQGRCKWRHTERKPAHHCCYALSQPSSAALECTAAACTGKLVTDLNMCTEHTFDLYSTRAAELVSTCTRRAKTGLTRHIM